MDEFVSGHCWKSIGSHFATAIRLDKTFKRGRLTASLRITFRAVESTNKLNSLLAWRMTYNDFMHQIVIRYANEPDLPALGRLGALLLRTHYGFDQQRFMAPHANTAEGYAWFLGSQLGKQDVVVLVAEQLGTIVGYVYAGLEPQSWKELREASGFIHDVVVEESSRGKGIAASLLQRAIEWLRAHGAPRVVLWTAEQNAAAQHLFSRIGFRRTMVEMTLEVRKDER